MEKREVSIDELAGVIAEACGRFYKGDYVTASNETERILEEVLLDGESEGCGIRVYATPKPNTFIVEQLEQ